MLTLNHIRPNQTVLSFDNGVEVFFSYNTPVAAFVPGRGYVRTSQHYSVTTSKHINSWARYADPVDQIEINRLVNSV